MKKLRIALITILCLLSAFSFSLTVSADEVEYYLKPLGMTIEFPDNMTVKTKENSADLRESIYLEAVNADNTLSITISMNSDENTKAAKSFMDMSTASIREYKENMEAEGYTAGADCSYGGVPFLDFKKKDANKTSITQSITIVNGMSISVISQSPGDAFTTEEIELIGSCLESIRFDNLGVAEKKVTFWGVVLWILLIIIFLSVLFIVFSFFMGKRNAQRKQAIREEKRKKADYDVLKRADISHKKREHAKKVGGYKTSSDYFDNDFETADTYTSTSKTALAPAPTKTQKAVKNTKNTVTHMGYFFKNLKKEMGKNKSSAKKKTSKKAKNKVRDYDIFND